MGIVLLETNISTAVENTKTIFGMGLNHIYHEISSFLWNDENNNQVLLGIDSWF